MVKMCQTQWLGKVEYGEALSLQKELAALRAANEIPDTLLLLEHPSTYTVGRDGHREHLLIHQEELAQRGVSLHRVDRGGSVTYHGPGQLVCYPILNIRELGYSYHRYLKALESVIIRTLSLLKVRAFSERAQPEVWVFTRQSGSNQLEEGTPLDRGIAQIAAIGVKLNERNITTHGFFINVNPNLAYFDLIMPCGVLGCQVTSLQQVLSRPIHLSLIIEPLIQSFCETFNMERITSTPQILTNRLGQPASLSYVA
jgi:lipoate-protein ligase B